MFCDLLDMHYCVVSDVKHGAIFVHGHNSIIKITAKFLYIIEKNVEIESCQVKD